MPEKNNELVVVNSWKDDLKAQANIHGRALANSWMESLKVNAGEYAKYAVQRLIDHWIDCINAKLSA